MKGLTLAFGTQTGGTSQFYPTGLVKESAGEQRLDSLIESLGLKCWGLLLSLLGK